MSAARPKPRYDGKAKPPYGEFLDWLDRQFTEVLSSSYASLKARLDAIADEIDLTSIEADIDALDTTAADHETRIDALEADEGANKTSTIWFRADSLGASASTAYYLRYEAVPDTGITNAQRIAPANGFFENLCFRMITTTADADTFSMTLNINGSDTALTIGGLACNDGTLHSDISHSVSVSKGDYWCVKQLNGAGAITSNDWDASVDFVHS